MRTNCSTQYHSPQARVWVSRNVRATAMKITFYSILISILLCSCSTVHTETKGEIDTENFSLQMENYKNIIKVDVQKITMTKKTNGYPLVVQTACKVLKVYRGNYSKSQINLFTEKEEIPASISPHFQTYFFFYNSEDKNQSNEYWSEFRLWEYSDAYEKYLKGKL